LRAQEPRRFAMPLSLVVRALSKEFRMFFNELRLILAASAMMLATQGNAQESHINPAGLPTPAGYSHVVIAPPGTLVTISGQVALDASGNVVGAGDFEAQCTQVFDNLTVALASVGLTFDDVILTDTYVTDLQYLPVLRQVRARYLSEQHPPASTLVQVTSLFRPELLIEVSVQAIKAGDKGRGDAP
jgi:enamine deaminase RidA (YjgF/YER057c/UK114 family)